MVKMTRSISDNFDSKKIGINKLKTGIANTNTPTLNSNGNSLKERAHLNAIKETNLNGNTNSNSNNNGNSKIVNSLPSLVSNIAKLGELNANSNKNENYNFEDSYLSEDNGVQVVSKKRRDVNFFGYKLTDSVNKSESNAHLLFDRMNDLHKLELSFYRTGGLSTNETSKNNFSLRDNFELYKFKKEK